MSELTHKDLFSKQAAAYAAFRPSYPQKMFDFLLDQFEGRRSAWDCATGNGQVATVLARYFEIVHATDISRKQLDEAPNISNVVYSLSPAEKTTFADDSFDLITVGQALHWFDQPEFFREVNRVGKKGGILAVWGYSFLQVHSTIDSVILDFYNNTVGKYWDKARKLVEDEYRSIEFPFQEIVTPTFYINVEWNLTHLAGYLSSWSATQRFIEVEGIDPVPSIMHELSKFWKEDERKNISFPLFFRLGKIA
ncbi:MAG: class I SAM-dependent methyltransferase [Chryseolinea sp.]